MGDKCSYCKDDLINFPNCLACKCNSQGTLSNRNTLYIFQRDNSACNNDSCTCNSGYAGNDCNVCDFGYIVTSTENGENTCEPGFAESQTGTMFTALSPVSTAHLDTSAVTYLSFE